MGSYRDEERKVARDKLKKFLTEQKSNGFRGFISKESGIEVYGAIVLEKTLMHIEYNINEGWLYSLSYVPSRSHGSGCRCKEIKENDLSFKTLKLHERACINYANSFKAEMYKNTDVALNKFLKDYGNQYDEV